VILLITKKGNISRFGVILNYYFFKQMNFFLYSWKPILDNIEARCDAYLEQENRVNRRRMVDNRIHACLYFIAPTGHA
jgi:septin family protein